MPIIDAEPYRLEQLSDAIHAIGRKIGQYHSDISDLPVHYANIFVGTKQLEHVSRQPWMVSEERPHALICAVFRQVDYEDVFPDRDYKGWIYDALGKPRGLCITVLWSDWSARFTEFHDAVAFANSIVEGVELYAQVPCPVPLREIQIADRFQLGTIYPFGSEKEPDVGYFDNNAQAEPWVTDEIVRAAHVTSDPEAATQVFNDGTLRADLWHAMRWRRRAIRLLSIEEYSEGVVSTNIWMETFLVRLAIRLNDAAGTPIPGIENGFSGSIARFVSNSLGTKFLGGVWDGKQTSRPFGRWIESCVKLRNRIVHSGHFADLAEASEAFAASSALREYVVDRARTVKDPAIAAVLDPLVNE